MLVCSKRRQFNNKLLLPSLRLKTKLLRLPVTTCQDHWPNMACDYHFVTPHPQREKNKIIVVYDTICDVPNQGGIPFIRVN